MHVIFIEKGIHEKQAGAHLCIPFSMVRDKEMFETNKKYINEP